MKRDSIRMPDELYAKIAALAKADERSVNAQYNYLLKKSIAQIEKKSEEGKQ